MARKPRKSDVVLVEWVDSAMLEGVWHGPDAIEDHRCVVCYSVGFLGRMTKKNVVLCSSVTPDQVARVHAIPTVAVKSIKVLVRGKKPK